MKNVEGAMLPLPTERCGVSRRFLAAACATLPLCASSGHAGAQPRGTGPPETDGVRVPGGLLEMGSVNGEQAEMPVHSVMLAPFYIDRTEVTNAAFRAFVELTGHVTDPERAGWGWHWDGRWRKVEGATWRHPRGPHSAIETLDNHPVVQVSWHDASAYCRWRSKRLPTEAQWERAARGAGERPFPWGHDAPRTDRRYRASYGTDSCCAADDGDGYRFTAPVGRYVAGRSPFGADDMAGNVWEWVQDTYSRDFYARSPLMAPVNDAAGPFRVIRGGGWGNNPWGLRATLRHANRPHAGLSMVGFRCAWDP